MSEKRGKATVSIIIVNWNGRKLLEDCLNSIMEKTDHPNFRVIVVDNGSTDNSVEMVRNKFPTVELIINERNLGFAKANNQGIKYAFKMGSNYFLLLNNDTKITQKEWLKKLVESMTHPKTGILGCKILYPDGSPHQHLSDHKTEVNTIKGAVFLIKTEVVERIGLFDEKFSPAYGEEGDYCARAKAAGFKVMYGPSVTIIHQGEATATRVFSAISLKRLRFKHRIRYMLLNFPLKRLIKNFFWMFFVKKNENKRFGVTNFKLREDCLFRLNQGYIQNLIDLPDILLKRKNRAARIWY